MHHVLKCLLMGGLVVAAGQAVAATGNVIFNGSIATTCTLTVANNGTMTAGTDLKSLSSKNALGVAGTVALLTTGNVTLSVDSAVSNVTKPAEDTATTTWTPSYGIIVGTHPTADRTTSFPIATPGADTVTVHLAGTKSGSDVFAPGNYSATVTVRCE